VDVWLDEWAIKVGDSISRKIEDGLRSCKYIILSFANMLADFESAAYAEGCNALLQASS